jgi:hypothetical protein
MNPQNKELARKELEKIYENNFKWLQAGKVLRSRFSSSLNENPKLNLILKLALFANVGIWLTLVLISIKLL